jgi:multicomponent Na+:H+ antiporter subunit G
LIEILIELMAAIFLLGGSVVIFIGSIGLLRLPDFFCRLHSAGVIDSLGAWLVLAGLLLLAPSLVVAFKVIAIVVLLFVLTPVSSHALGRSALESDEEVPGEHPDQQDQT